MEINPDEARDNKFFTVLECSGIAYLSDDYGTFYNYDANDDKFVNIMNEDRYLDNGFSIKNSLYYFGTNQILWKYDISAFYSYFNTSAGSFPDALRVW
jgi:hypothetical protein